MARKFTVIALLDREEHRELKRLVKARKPRVFIKDVVREAVLALMRRAA
jgi:hypothetical protein